MVNSIQAIYKSQGIQIADKHIELVVRQMTSSVEIRKSGDTPFLRGEVLDKKMAQEIAWCLNKLGYHLPIYQPYINGVTRSTLRGESFLSAASFQETRKILAQSAIEGKVDWMRSIKANVITGRLIPAGTGVIG